jgi:hypothetical protein
MYLLSFLTSFKNHTFYKSYFKTVTEYLHWGFVQKCESFYSLQKKISLSKVLIQMLEIYLIYDETKNNSNKHLRFF